MNEQDSNSSVEKNDSYADRLIGVLQMFADDSAVLGVTEIARHLSIPPSSVHRLLLPLVAHGLVERTEQRKYRIGTEMFRIAARIESQFELLSVAKPLMAAITAECGETCILGLLTPWRNRIVISHKVDSLLPLRYKFSLLKNLSPVWGSIGRATMAWMTPTDIRRALGEARPSPATGDPPPSRIDIEEESAEIRRRGFAISHGQIAGPEMIGVSSAFFDANGRVRGSIGVIAPEFRMMSEQQQRVETLVCFKARQLSRKLGYRPDRSGAARGPVGTKNNNLGVRTDAFGRSVGI